ncbi:MAG TPA: hypothetical protein VJ695_05295 [Nitrososphaera sp.]|nr:hypothetical protein [Nitrososphaera sp.]
MQVTRMRVEVLVTQSAFAGSIFMIEGPNNIKKANASEANCNLPLLLQNLSSIILYVPYIQESLQIKLS